MQIQVNTDNNVDGHAALVQRVEADLSSALARYDGRLTRIEVHLGDVNAARPGETDKRCLIEARPTSHQPVAVTHHGATLEEAIDGAIKKLRRALETTLGRLKDHKGGESIRTKPQD
jgi:ribosome-associated translation inhibitor RaiA